jgi:hypothetical protein
MLFVLNNGNPQSYQTCFRNVVQMTSTMLMKQVYFILPHQMISKVTNMQLYLMQRTQRTV